MDNINGAPLNEILKELYYEVHEASVNRTTKAFKEELNFVIHIIRQNYKTSSSVSLDRLLSEDLIYELKVAGFSVEVCSSNPKTLISWSN